jgi:hypothetical protein
MPINRINPFMNFDISPDTATVSQVFKTKNLTHFPIKKYQWVRREQCFYRQKYQ